MSAKLEPITIITTENNPLDLQQPSQPDANSAKPEHKGSNVWLIMGLAILAVIIIIVIYFVKSSSAKSADEANELNDKLDELTKENEMLQNEIQQLQSDNSNYVNHINRLADQLEQQQVAAQQSVPKYSELTPMTENSYDAPDPDEVAQKPQIIKDKEQIRAMVNSKRQTVQDVIDEQKAAKEDETQQNTQSVESELKQLTADENEHPDDESVDDKNVEDLMNIIQAQ